VALGVRAIRPDQLLEWVEVMHVAFHNKWSAAEEARLRRELFDQDFERTIAAVDGAKLVGTLESFAAALTLPGGSSLSVDAISGVSTLPTHRRRGALSGMISHDLRAARERGEAASILVPSEYPIYGRFGFGPATTRLDLTINTAAAHFTRAAEGTIEFIEPSRLRELAPPIFDRFRAERPGQIDREPNRWDVSLGLRGTPWRPADSPVRCAISTNPAGSLDGYLFYQSEENRQDGRFGRRVILHELIALTSDAYLALWRFCCEMDLVNEIQAGMRCADEPLQWLLDNPRAAIRHVGRTDFLWVRALDTPRYLESRRYACQERLVLEVSDPLELSGGRFALECSPAGATCRVTDEAADLTLGMTALGAISLGGQNTHVLADAGLIDEEQPGALARAERVFRWPIVPWCSTMF
jgi:predicted acetyltransferase